MHLLCGQLQTVIYYKINNLLQWNHVTIKKAHTQTQVEIKKWLSPRRHFKKTGMFKFKLQLKLKHNNFFLTKTTAKNSYNVLAY